ncbi:hypothetical protein [Brevundimonas sp.]|uniref:hypothetical protein n=1 Tax=Brevundimonas sp. TaxID=1871086 RepID=UPI003D0F089B
MTFETNPLRALAGAGLAALLLMSCKPAATAQAPADDTQSSPGAVAFADTPPLSATVAAAPRLVGDSAQVAAINADLALIDAMAKTSTAECEGGGFSRTVTQPMTGPGYVTYMISDEYECGGPYPSTTQTPVTYDLTTGRRVDWTRTLSAWAVTVDDTTDVPAGSVGYLHSPALARWYSARMLASTDQEWLAECRDVFDPEQLNQSGFLVWADAGTSGIAVSPQLPHVVQACGEVASLTAADMQAAGVPAAMIAAITTAGEGRNWLPYQEGV